MAKKQHRHPDYRLFIGVYSTGLSFADKDRELHGDYMKLAFLPYRTLELEWTGAPMPASLRAAIKDEAAKLRRRRGELFSISSSGQTVRLGG